MHAIRLTTWAVFCLSISGCIFTPTGYNSRAEHEAAVARHDQSDLDNLENRRRGTEITPDSEMSLRTYLVTSLNFIRGGAPERMQLDREVLIQNGLEACDRYAKAAPKYAERALAYKGDFLMELGRRDEAIAFYKASMAKKPNEQALTGLLPTYRANADFKTMDRQCKQVYSRMDNKELLGFTLLDNCAKYRGGKTTKERLPWASKRVRDEYERQRLSVRRSKTYTARNEQRNRDNQRAAGYGSSSSPGSQNSGPAHASVSLKNECPKTVKLFFGDKPKYGSGRYTSLSSNSITSYSMKAGDMIWIVDDSQNGLSSFSAPAGNSSVIILKSCTGFRFR